MKRNGKRLLQNAGVLQDIDGIFWTAMLYDVKLNHFAAAFLYGFALVFP
ncbi:MAG: hypothetical protein HFG47_09510 [Lachnospiraceae bacterium]|nr:hypothetical protein [Lachnospiraceae bacterium]